MQPQSQPHPAQQRFDENYITSIEIRERLGIPRSAVFHAIRRGLLPVPITVDGRLLSFWERNHVEEPLAAWERSIHTRRGGTA